MLKGDTNKSRFCWYIATPVFYLAGAVSVLMTALFGWFFYFFYWRWRGQFNEQGRYFHEPESLVFSDDAFLYVVPTVVFATLAVVLLLAARASRRKAHYV